MVAVLFQLVVLYVALNLISAEVYAFDYKDNMCPMLEPECSCDKASKIECSNFTSTRQLRLSKRIKHKSQPLTSISLVASTRPGVILDDSLSLKNLDFNVNKLEFKINNFDGIELNENPFSAYKDHRLPYFHMNNSTFQFFYRQKSFDYICDLVILDMHMRPVFSSFKYLFLGNSKANIFTREVCHAVFKNAKIDWLHMSNMTPENRLKFQLLEPSKQQSIEQHLNSQIKYFQIQSSHLDCLDGQLLDQHVFRDLERLSIEFSHLHGIQSDVFRHLYQLRRVHLWLFNFKQFIRGDNTWMKYLNSGMETAIKKNLQHIAIDRKQPLSRSQQLIIEFNDENNEYTYPDEDFCFFKDFPHKRQVFPLINTKLKLNCTCTLLWLIQNLNSSEKALDNPAVRPCFRQAHFQQQLVNCKFEQRVEQCFKNHRRFLLGHSSTCNRSFSSFLIVPLFCFHIVLAEFF